MAKNTRSSVLFPWQAALLYWGIALGLAVGLAAGGVWAQYGLLTAETPIQSLLSVQLVPYQGLLMLLAGGLTLVAWYSKQSWLVDITRSTLYFGASLGLGLLLLVWWEGYQVLQTGRMPLTNLFEVSHFFLSLIALYGLWLVRRTRQEALLPFVGLLVVLAALLVLWLEGLDQAGPRHVVPALKSYWLPSHVLTNFLAYAAFTVAAGAGVMGLVKAKGMPKPEVAEMIAFRAISLGFPLFTLAIFLGAIWAYEAWGGYWSWDPKETWALITWLVYASYLHARLHGKVPVRGLCWWVILGWLVMMFCFLGVNLFLSGLHSYGQLA